MMTEQFRSNPLRLLEWQRDKAIFYALSAAAAWVAIEFLGLEALKLPVMPITVVGAAIGIFTSFRANQAYDRWWEGRKLWGRMINSSRHWCTQILGYLGKDERAEAEELVLRHVTYVHALRCLLRKQKPYADKDFLRHLTEEDRAFESSTNLTHALLDRQMQVLTRLADDGKLDGHRLESLDGTILDLLNIQGGCERIKGTPLPRGYGFIAELLVQIFAIMLPFAMIEDLGLLAIPINVLVCLSFALISEAGRVLEDPFSLFYNGLPLKALSIKIERNLRERLGHEDLPDAEQPSAIGVLM